MDFQQRNFDVFWNSETPALVVVMLNIFRFLKFSFSLKVKLLTKFNQVKSNLYIKGLG
jgi:hypothetical protein